ncbi:hypothetical protein [Mesorhizobium sp. M0870]|uniref:hypothetical protein n=1 Tax=Mesorhizobium sp. M0870 TaxID=2957016 RepID=UPI003334F2D5
MPSNASALDIAQMSARRLKSLSGLDETGLDDEARLEGGEVVTRRKLAADGSCDGAKPRSGTTRRDDDHLLDACEKSNDILY